MNRNFSTIALTLAAGCMAGGQAAAQDSYAGDELIDIKIATAASSDLAGALGAIAVPLCKKEMRSWRQSEPALYVWPEGQSRSLAETTRALKKRFPVADHEAVIVSQPVLSPFAEAGFKAGDVLPANTRPERVPKEPADTFRVREWAAFEQNPELIFTVRRGEETSQVKVRYRMDCGGGLFVSKSRYRYAQSSSGLASRSGGGIISLTYPFLKSLSLREQAIVMAHEIGQTATGANLVAGGGTNMATSVVGALFMPGGGNNELARIRKPTPEQLVDADHVAMWLLSLLDITPEEYTRVLAKLDAENDGIFIPEYKTGRPLSWDRKAAFANAVALWKKDKTMAIPRGYSAETLTELNAWAAATGLVDKIKVLINGASVPATQ